MGLLGINLTVPPPPHRADPEKLSPTHCTFLRRHEISKLPYPTARTQESIDTRDEVRLYLAAEEGCISHPHFYQALK